MQSANDNMRSVVGFIARSPDRCWRAFTDAASLSAWVPGLRKVKVIAARPDGLAQEVLFDFAASLTYSLVYSYDLEARRVTWEPRIGRRDAIRGFACIEPWDGGSRLTYGIDAGDGRAAHELDEPRNIVSAFAQWIEAARPTRTALRI